MRLESDRVLVVSLPGPRKLSVEPDGRKGPLLLFANPPEVDPPKPEAPGVIYFGPGIHRPGRIEVASHQTLYLAAGAIVKGGVWAQGENILPAGPRKPRPVHARDHPRNLDILHFTMTPFLFEPGEQMRLEDVTVENVRLHGDGQAELIRLRPVVNQYMRNQVPGHVRNIRFRNVSLTGKPGTHRVHLSGADAAHAVRDVTFENVVVLGESLTAGSARLQIGEHVEGAQFTDGAGSGTQP